MRSKTKESDQEYLNLIADLKMQLKQVKNKSDFIKKLSDGKNKDLLRNNKD